jgi:hypothetical protein
MSTATAKIAAKVAMIFGVGAQITGTYSKTKVIYTDGKSSLEFDVTDENRKEVGTYTVTVKSETELEETFQKAPAAASTVGKNSNTTATQSPAYGFGTRMPR